MIRLALILLMLLPGSLAAQETRPTKDEQPESRPGGKKRSRPARRRVKKSAQEQVRAPAKEEQSPWLAIVGATVHPVSSSVIKGGTVLVKDGKIVMIGVNVKIPEGARVVDAKGMHVAPGFVASMSSGLFGRARSRGKDKLADAFDPWNFNMLLALASGITCAHVGASSPSPFTFIFGGRGGGLGGSATGTMAGSVAKLAYGTIEGVELKDPAGLYFTYATNRRSQQEQTRKVLGDTRKYVQARRKWLAELQGGKKDAKAPKLSSKLKPWVKVFDGDLRAFTQAGTRSEIEAVLRLCDEYALPVVIYGAEEAWIIPAEIGRRPVQVLVDTRGAGFDLYRHRIRPGARRFVEGPTGWSLETGAKLSGAGVPWATVTQSKGIDFVGIPGRDITGLTFAAALAVRGGASNEAALQSITLTAARILGVADRVGSLEAGKDADILMLDREPLDYRSFVQKAWVNGRLAYDKAKFNLWNHVQTDRSRGFGPWQRYGIWSEWPDGIDRLLRRKKAAITRGARTLPAKPAAGAGGAKSATVRKDGED